MMTKHDTIEAIRKLNPTAGADFLAEFSGEDLARYLQRLSETGRAGTRQVPFEPRDAGSVEVEPEETVQPSLPSVAPRPADRNWPPLTSVDPRNVEPSAPHV